jgi:hypothetical protein
VLSTLNIQPGLLYVRDGKDELPERGPVVNKVVPFLVTDAAGVYRARFRKSKALGCQFKVFFDSELEDAAEVTNERSQSGFLDPTAEDRRAGRIWVLLRDFPICVTVDG